MGLWTPPDSSFYKHLDSSFRCTLSRSVHGLYVAIFRLALQMLHARL